VPSLLACHGHTVRRDHHLAICSSWTADDGDVVCAWELDDSSRSRERRTAWHAESTTGMWPDDHVAHVKPFYSMRVERRETVPRVRSSYPGSRSDGLRCSALPRSPSEPPLSLPEPHMEGRVDEPRGARRPESQPHVHGVRRREPPSASRPASTSSTTASCSACSHVGDAPSYPAAAWRRHVGILDETIGARSASSNRSVGVTVTTHRALQEAGPARLRTSRGRACHARLERLFEAPASYCCPTGRSPPRRAQVHEDADRQNREGDSPPSGSRTDARRRRAWSCSEARGRAGMRYCGHPARGRRADAACAQFSLRLEEHDLDSLLGQPTESTTACVTFVMSAFFFSAGMGKSRCGRAALRLLGLRAERGHWRGRGPSA